MPDRWVVWCTVRIVRREADALIGPLPKEKDSKVKGEEESNAKPEPIGTDSPK